MPIREIEIESLPQLDLVDNPPTLTGEEIYEGTTRY